jgi:conjugal transfer pilus assembly protein TraB
MKFYLRQQWDSLPAGKKRLLLVCAGACLFVGVCLLIAQGRDTGPVRPAANKGKYDLLHPDMAKEVLAEKVTRDIADLRSEIRGLKDENNRLRQEIANSAATAGASSGGVAGAATGPIGTATAQERELGLRMSLQGMGAMPVEKGSDAFPPIPAQPKVPGSSNPLVINSGPPSTTTVSLPSPPPQGVVVRPPGSEGGSVSVADARVMGSLRFPKPGAGGASSPYAPAGAGAGGAGGQSDQKETEPESSRYYNFYVPTSAHFRVRLLTGLDAPTGPKASGQPHPVVLRVQDLSFLPNNVRQNISGCHVLGEAIGELSSERARVRGLTLSCVDADDNQVIDESIDGFVADVDGKGSLRGRVVSKQGRFLAAALTASFVEGVGKAFQNIGSTTTYVGAYGSAQSSDVDNFQDGFKQGMGAGIGQAAQKLSDFYLKAAEDLYPVIEIAANRDGTFILTKGKRFSADKRIFLPVKDAGGKDSVAANKMDNDL